MANHMPYHMNKESRPKLYRTIRGLLNRNGVFSCSLIGREHNRELYFVCYMIERVARELHQKNQYVVNHISREEWERIFSLAGVLHCENPLKIECEWIEEYHLEESSFDITDVNKELVDEIPSETQMGKVYTRLILSFVITRAYYNGGF